MKRRLIAKMSSGDSDGEASSTLRERAEAALVAIATDLKQMSEQDIQRLVHDLQVHQIELQMQNEELRETQLKLAQSCDLYTDIYDFAPVGYLTLDADMTIEKANLSASTLFAVERRQLVGRPLSHFIAPQSQDTLYLHHHALLESDDKQTCVLILLLPEGTTVYAQMETVRLDDPITGTLTYRCIMSDITRQKQSEDALRKSEQRLTSLIEAMPDLVQFKDAAGRWQVANAPALQVFGIGDIDWRGLTDIELAERLSGMSEELRACAQSDARVIEGGMAVTLEEPITLADGSVKSFEVMKVPLQERDGSVSGLVIVGHDVTSRKRAEEKILELNTQLQQQVTERTAQLRVSEGRFRGIYQHTATGIAIADWKGNVLQSNPAYSRITGYSEAELRQLPFLTLFNLDDQEHKAEVVRRLQSKEIESFEVESRFIQKNGNPIWVHKVASSLPSEEGAESNLVVLVTDISQRRHAEEELRRSEVDLSVFFSSAPIGLIWLESDGRILRVNQAQLKMLRLSSKEVLGHRIDEFDVDGEMAKVQVRLAQGETIRDHRARLRGNDGSPTHVLIDAIAIMEEGRLLRTDWFIRDISRRIELEREMLDVGERERQQVGRELHDDLGQILHGLHFISSELQTRMREKELPEADELNQITCYLDEALDTARNLAHGLQPVSNLPEGLVSALRTHAARIRNLYGVKCRFICPKPVEIADPKVATHLFRIAQEAVNNAIKHAKCTRITIQLKTVNGRILLGVRDDGNGRIPQDGPSKGIGLRVMQFRATAVEGSLAVQRTPKGGTEVVCTLPFPVASTSSVSTPPFNETES